MALHNGMTLRNMSLVLLWTETVTPGMTPEGTQGHIKARGALSLGPALVRVFTHSVVYNDAYLFQKSSLSTCYVPGPWRAGKKLIQQGF